MVRRADPLAAARRLRPQIIEHAERTETDRTLPPELVAQLREAGLFGLMTPASLGGLEVRPRTIIGVIDEITHADAATGWTVLIGQGAGYLAWLDMAAARSLVAEYAMPIVVGSMMPRGTVARLDSERADLQLSGRWPFASGAEIGDLMIGAFVQPPAGGPPAKGLPPIRFAIFPAAQATVHDTWHTMGLRGTGSHDIEVQALRIPHEHTFDPFGPAREPGPLYRLPYMTFLLTAMAGFPLGAARRIIDEYRAVVAAKRNNERVLLAETAVVQADLALCESKVDAARASVLHTADAVWGQALGGVPDIAGRARFNAAVQHAMRAALEVTDAALRACGASQLYAHAPMERYFRDLQTAAQHIAFGIEARCRVGAALLGLDVPAAMI